MLKTEFARCNVDYCVYLRRNEDDDFLILTLYADNILVAGSCMKKISALKKKYVENFFINDLGETKQILGMQITRDRKNKKLWLSEGRVCGEGAKKVQHERGYTYDYNSRWTL